MRLEDGFDLLNGHLTAIIDCVKGLRERFATLRTFEALIAFARSVVLMGFRVVAVGTLHHASPDSSDADDESHVCLVHDQIREAHPITLPDNSEPIPDLAVVKPLGSVYLKRHPHPGDIYWVVEFSNSTLEKDLGEKRIAYGEAGIGEYWVVNLRDRQLHVFRELQGGDYCSEAILKEGTVAALAFPEVSMQVARLLNP
jgi:hypothetical protein